MNKDIIYHQDAINELRKHIDKSAKGDIGSFYNTIIQRCIEWIEQIPSVQLEEKIGTWIYYYNREQNGECPFECSVCGMGSDVDSDHCMRCGAKMIGGRKNNDVIWRQDAINVLWKEPSYSDPLNVLAEARDRISALQPAHQLYDEEWRRKHYEISYNQGFLDGYKMCEKKLPRWTPCSEGLSEEGQDVLITKEPYKIKGYEQEVIKAKRSVDPRSGKIEWWSPECGALTDKAVLAWMPMPEKYKGGESDEITNADKSN